MGFKLKPSVRRRIKEQLGATEEQLAEAEKNCDGALCFIPKDHMYVRVLKVQCANGVKTLYCQVDTLILQPEDEKEG